MGLYNSRVKLKRKRPGQAGRHSLVIDAQKFSEELGMDLKLQHSDPISHTGEGKK